MNDEILRLAKECGFLADTAFMWPEELEAFYKAAFNAGIEAAAKEAEFAVPACVGKSGQGVARSIRELEMK